MTCSLEEVGQPVVQNVDVDMDEDFAADELAVQSIEANDSFPEQCSLTKPTGFFTRISGLGDAINLDALVL